MKNRNLLIKSLVSIAVSSIIGSGLAYADLPSGVNSILSAAAGHSTTVTTSVAKAPSVNAVKPTNSVPPETPVMVNKPSEPIIQHPAPVTPVHDVIQKQPAAIINHAAPTPASLPAMPVREPAATVVSPLPSPVPVESMNPQQNHAIHASDNRNTAGYINPFVGSPSVEQKLSNQLALLKTKTEIMKEKAKYAKYAHESNILNNSSSPQMQALQQRVSELESHMSDLEQNIQQSVRARQVAHKIRVEKMKKPVVTSIISDMGKLSATVQMGKTIKTVHVGDSVDGNMVTAIHLHSVDFANGQRILLGDQVGHYLSATWKSSQSHGDIASPQSGPSIANRLEQEAHQAGIKLPAYGNNQGASMPPLNGLAPMVHP